MCLVKTYVRIQVDKMVCVPSLSAHRLIKLICAMRSGIRVSRVDVFVMQRCALSTSLEIK